MDAASIMTVPAISIGLDTPLDRAQELMDQHGFRHLPVVAGDQLVGMVTDRDILEATGWLRASVHACRGPQAAEAVPSLAREIMHAPVHDIAPEDPLDKVCALLVENGIGSVPVTRAGVLIGIVTEVDVLRSLVVDDALERLGHDDDPSVDKVMSSRPFEIASDATLGEAEKLCHEKGVRHLVVDIPGDLPGIVSDRDLRRAAGRGRPANTPLFDSVTARALTVRPSTPLSSATQMLLDNRIGALPVVSGDGADVAGILSVSDVLAHCVEVYRSRS